MNRRLITAAELSALAAEDTTAHRLWTGADGWVERFGDDYLVSAADDGGQIVGYLPEWLAALGLRAARIFVRRLVKQPGGDDKPTQTFGAVGPMETIVTERGLRFGIDFSAGYSVGLFCDQRANRAYLETLRPLRMLNCFAYTCAFSVAAARAGAETLNLDLSRKSLDRGRANLALSGFEGGRHRFIADDVFAVLPRLARRGERFDAIVLDPPTFSRGAGGRVFRAERDLCGLLERALDLIEPGGRVLLSSNAQHLDVAAIARGSARATRLHSVPPPSEYPPDSAAATVWVVAG
ncbi:MAG: class I SAM-dependent methyltransferase [Terrimicrobiaceae bacterium]|nr:class I SAM-dependent methyltransferase [Terrimicrobiaceae bacterium]